MSVDFIINAQCLYRGHRSGCFLSGLTLAKCVDGVVPVSQVDDVTMFGLRGDVELQGGRAAVSVLRPQHFGADGEPQVTRGQGFQSGCAFIHHNLGHAVVYRHNGDLHSLRAPSFEHSVGENIKVSVCAVTDPEGERVL